jgi:hypothetical protein
VVGYIKNHLSNALLFATSKLRKSNKQENSQNAYSYAEIYDTPETKAIAECVATSLIGDFNSLED